MWQNNGFFIVPSGQMNDIYVQGLLDGKEAAWEVQGAGTSATGRVLPSQGTWYLNYSSTSGGTTVDIHLEGDAIPL